MASAEALGLIEDEVQLVLAGLREWGGPVHLTETLARAFGFAGATDFFEQSRRIRESLERGAALPPTDWRRALLATEVAFASDVVGSGVDWETTTGVPDAVALTLLRSVQRKIRH
ncbi:hypothetical protein [Curtobacterium sp. NPDC089185]|uniref:hypothetical protein n=1 Tax=Curtobacterium sp. NPDC089185 TaxID=3154968 RepID=UPI003444EFA1